MARQLLNEIRLLRSEVASLWQQEHYEFHLSGERSIDKLMELTEIYLVLAAAEQQLMARQPTAGSKN